MNSLKGFWQRQYIEKAALKNVNLEIESGKIIGLIGANGAGKTTLLKILSGLITPSSGSASVLGFNPWERDYRYLRKISLLLGQKNQLWWDISPLDSFSLLARIYDLDPKKAANRVQELAKLLKCTHVLETQLRRLSLGERMKMELIGALLHEPEVLFLDEPTIGLDIVAQSTIREFLATYVKERKTTVILTSHYMDDIAKLADQLLLISRGEIVYNGTVKHFITKTSIKQQVVVVLEQIPESDIALSLGRQLTSGQKEHSFEIENNELPKLISEISANGKIQDLKVVEANFEDVIRHFLETESRVL
ncbi:MAG: ATP-binding cassette domain-containing protein [Bdellovibrionota bacterium]